MSGGTFIGERVDGKHAHELEPSQYGPVERDGVRVWIVCTPNGHAGDLSRHDVTEHEDGTITVSPSILVSDASGELWHGYLERGVWREM